MHFRKTTHRNLDLNSFYDDRGIPGVSKVLRNTVAFVESIKVRSCLANYERKKKFEIKIIELISHYCDERKVRLTLKYFNQPDDLVETLPPLIILQRKRMDSTWAQISGELDEIIQDTSQRINFSDSTLKDLDVLSLKWEHNSDYTLRN